MRVEKLAPTNCVKHRIDCIVNDVMCANWRETVALTKNNEKCSSVSLEQQKTKTALNSNTLKQLTWESVVHFHGQLNKRLQCFE